MPAASAAVAAATVRVGLINVFAAVPSPIRFTGQRERLSRLPDAIHDACADLDVLCILEAVDPAFCTDFVGTMRDKHRWVGGITRPALQQRRMLAAATTTTATPATTAPPTLMCGGIYIMSRQWPIVEQQSIQFRDACGSDALIAKGAVYAKLQLQQQSIGGRSISSISSSSRSSSGGGGMVMLPTMHIICTHLQAWTTAETIAVRRRQIAQIAAFIDSLDIASDQPLLLLGDLNIDMHGSSGTVGELRDALAALQMTMPELDADSPQFSISNQNSLYGLDSIESYTSPQWPDGCKSHYERHHQCPCCPNQWVDYCLISARHLQPVQTARSRAIPLYSRQPFRMRVGLLRWRNNVRDVTDHSLVVTTLSFPAAAAAADAGGGKLKCGRHDGATLASAAAADNDDDDDSMGYGKSFIITLAVLVLCILLLLLHTIRLTRGVQQQQQQPLAL